MPAITPGDAERRIVLTPRITLQPSGQWQGSADIAQAASGVLGNDESPSGTVAPLDLFEAAEPAIELNVQQAATGVLGEEASQLGTLAYQPEDQAVYALLQAIQTPDGIIYDFTLPEQTDEGGMVLGSPSDGRTLRFPINPLVVDSSQPQEPQEGVLGVGDFFGGVAGDIIGDIVLKRVVQVIKSPFEQSLNNAIRQAEGPPYAVAFRNGLQPIQGFEAWRTLLPPGGERRVLLFIHGFGSTIANNHLDKWISPLTEGYDAVLGYNHPTISRDPLDNARDLLEMIPEDLRLSVDLIAHSRGGLVARSLVELADARDCFNPRTLITNGTPHAGTRLADPERWDRLVSIGMTAASWLAAATGAAIWIPKVLEFVLKAAAQTVFDLPGIGAMTPGGAFLSKLNASAESSSMVAALQERVHYATVTSRFSIFGVEQPGFQQAFRTFAAQAFLDMPNDLVVPTESMNAIDQMGFVPKDRQLRVATDHFSYFDDAQVIEFIQQQLRR